MHCSDVLILNVLKHVTKEYHADIFHLPFQCNFLTFWFKGCQARKHRCISVHTCCCFTLSQTLIKQNVWILVCRFRWTLYFIIWSKSFFSSSTEYPLSAILFYKIVLQSVYVYIRHVRLARESYLHLRKGHGSLKYRFSIYLLIMNPS